MNYRKPVIQYIYFKLLTWDIGLKLIFILFYDTNLKKYNSNDRLLRLLS